jgi:predicted nucleic acid-binding protein
MDTNHVVGWEGDHQSILSKISSLPPEDTLIFASAITLGEMAAGHEMTPGGDPRRRQLVQNFLNIYVAPYALSITHSTARTYSEIIGRIWKKRPPSSAKIKTEAHLVSLGVDINDVWIVACAWEHGLTLLTTDSMTCIKEAISPDVEWDSWL